MVLLSLMSWLSPCSLLFYFLYRLSRRGVELGVASWRLATAPPENFLPLPKLLPPQPKFAYLTGQHELWRAKISEFFFKAENVENFSNFAFRGEEGTIYMLFALPGPT